MVNKKSINNTKVDVSGRFKNSQYLEENDTRKHKTGAFGANQERPMSNNRLTKAKKKEDVMKYMNEVRAINSRRQSMISPKEIQQQWYNIESVKENHESRK